MSYPDEREITAEEAFPGAVRAMDEIEVFRETIIRQVDDLLKLSGLALALREKPEEELFPLLREVIDDAFRKTIDIAQSIIRDVEPLHHHA